MQYYEIKCNTGIPFNTCFRSRNHSNIWEKGTLGVLGSGQGETKFPFQYNSLGWSVPAGPKAWKGSMDPFGRLGQPACLPDKTGSSLSSYSVCQLFVGSCWGKSGKNVVFMTGQVKRGGGWWGVTPSHKLWSLCPPPAPPLPADHCDNVIIAKIIDDRNDNNNPMWPLVSTCNFIIVAKMIKNVTTTCSLLFDQPPCNLAVQWSAEKCKCNDVSMQINVLQYNVMRRNWIKLVRPIRDTIWTLSQL